LLADHATARSLLDQIDGADLATLFPEIVKASGRPSSAVSLRWWKSIRYC
jgi:hypothetical protein